MKSFQRLVHHSFIAERSRVSIEIVNYIKQALMIHINDWMPNAEIIYHLEHLDALS
jgi:hypothetical protein